MPTAHATTHRIRRYVAVSALLALAVAMSVALHHPVRSPAELAAITARIHADTAAAAEDRAWIAAQTIKAHTATVTANKAQAATLRAAGQAAIKAATRTLASSATKATPESRAALQSAITATKTALISGVWAQMDQATTAVTAAQQAVEQSVADWQSAKDARAAAAKEAARVAAEQKAALLAAQKAAAHKPSTTTAPAVTAALEPGADAVIRQWLTGVGGNGVTISWNYVATCGVPDEGPLVVQGCVLFDGSDTMYLKPITVASASSTAGHYVTMHEYAHILQSRLGPDAVTTATDVVYGVGNGLEMSADCMAGLMGLNLGTYTFDCSGARGDIAASIIAGHL